jgi:hypothetical protein
MVAGMFGFGLQLSGFVENLTPPGPLSALGNIVDC